MENADAVDGSSILRLLPSIDQVLLTAVAKALESSLGQKRLASLARAATDALRSEIRGEAADKNGRGKTYTREELLDKAVKRLEKIWQLESRTGLQKVINATGVIIHTNLGRAPLSEKAKTALIETASGYCNLEYDLETGKRGGRGVRSEKLLAEITGTESAIIVNNCAAAAFLILTVFAGGREVILSRGELVEIGGDFRIPDVLAQSGAILREVGTTNRTKLSDYEKPIGDNTAMILKVHPSNYKIIGFTETPELAELAEMAHRNGVLLYEDAGSGAMFDLSKYGLDDEPVISQSIAAGVDIVSFSGDKLLGGPQAGLIVGRRDLIEKIRRHPLYRALRVDKLINAALEATLESFARETALADVPVLRMLSMTAEELANRCRTFAQKFAEKAGGKTALQIEIIIGNSVVGGGSAPGVHPETTLLAFTHQTRSAAELEQTLRDSDPPVIARILDDRVLIDLRTVAENEEEELLEILGR